VYFGIGNAYITPRQALEDPDAMLYTTSVVKLDGETGELMWHHQGVPNDLYDWDMQLSPIYVDGDEPTILAGGKMGYVYALDPDSGDLRWKTPVGEHNGHDDDSRRALEDPGSVTITPPLKILPGPYGGVETNMAHRDGVVYAAVVNLGPTLTDLDVNFGGASGTFDFDGAAGEMVALDVATGEIVWSTELSSMPFGAATLSNDLVFTTSFDGKIFALSPEDGAIVWQDDLPAGTNSTVAIADDTLITAASYPQGRGQEPLVLAYRLGATGEPATITPPTTGTTTEPVDGAAVFSRSCGSCHTLSAAGAEGQSAPNLDDVTLTPEAVEQQVRYGGGGMPAFEAQLSDEEIVTVARYVAEEAGAGTP